MQATAYTKGGLFLVMQEARQWQTLKLALTAQAWKKTKKVL